jgi:hydrogenase nickel incorporation protein HypA/HybF
MHEWALAEAVVAAASEIAEKEGLKEVSEVKIRVGELQQIEPEILEFALAQLKTTRLKNASFTIETAKAELSCRVCGAKWGLEKEGLDEHTKEAIHFVPEVAHAYIKCPKCGSPDFEILQGRGTWIERIKGEK